VSLQADVFPKIIKSTLEFIRLEGEVENKSFIKTLIQRLEGKTIKLSGFPDTLKVKAGEAKISFPLRHDWDSYFRDLAPSTQEVEQIH
jgi:arginine/serine-rich splicing factor 17